QIEPGMYLVALRDVTDRVNAQRIQQTVYDLASKLARADALEQIYEYALDALQSAMNVKRASIVLMDPDQMPVCAAHRGLSEQFCSLVEPQLDGQARKSGDEAGPIDEAVVIENVGQSSLDSGLCTRFKDEQISAFALIPLVYGDKVLGRLSLYFCSRRDVSTEDFSAASAIASHVSIVFGRKRAEYTTADSELQYRILF